MSIALYRKYRPKTFAEVSGQNHIKITLQNEIESDRVVHAYLFCGPRGTGKTTLARLLAKSVNCLDIQPGGEPCNKCQSCLDLIDNKALDIIEIDAASHTGVDNVRENVIQNARFTPTKNKFKVFIIDEVHMLSTQAFNALLKTLEEAPKHVIFILATTEAHKVPSTIISRCQRFDFKKINFPELVDRLKWILSMEEVRVDEKVLFMIAKQSGGCVRDAESLLEQVMSLGEKNITLEQAELILPQADFDLLYNLFSCIVKRQTATAIELVNKLVADGIDIVIFTNDFIEFSRRILLYKINGNLEEFSREIEDSVAEKILQLLPQVSEERIVSIIMKFISSKELFKQSYIVQLPLEIAIFELTSTGGGSRVPEPNLKPKETSPAQPVYQSLPEPDKAVAAEKSVVTSAEATGEASAPEEQQPEAQAQVTGPIDLTVINSMWGKFLELVKVQNYSLYMSLRMGKPISFEGNVLCLGFIFELQKQRIESHENKKIIAQIFQQLFSERIEYETRIEPSLTLADFSNHQNDSSPAPMFENSISDLASEFDGEVVDEI